MYSSKTELFETELFICIKMYLALNESTKVDMPLKPKKETNKQTRGIRNKKGRQIVFIRNKKRRNDIQRSTRKKKETDRGKVEGKGR